MKKLISILSNYWFEPMPPERLAILRIATGGFSLWYILTRLDMFQRMAGSGKSNFDPVGVLAWMERPISPDTFEVVSYILIGLNILYILGWKFKYIGPTFALLLLLFLTYRNSWSMIYHSRISLVLHVLVIGFVPSAKALSIDALMRKSPNTEGGLKWQYGWPIRLICGITVGSYFLAAVAKLAGNLSLEWMSGKAMRTQVAADSIRKIMLGSEGSALFEVIYPYTWMFLIMGVVTMVLELGAPLAMAKRRWGMIWAVATWLMHWGIFFIMGIRFRYQMTGLIFLSFFDTEKMLHYLHNLGNRFLFKMKFLSTKKSIEKVP